MSLPPRRWLARSPFGTPGVGACPPFAPHPPPPCPLTTRCRLLCREPPSSSARDHRGWEYRGRHQRPGHCHADVGLPISDLNQQSHPANKTQESIQKKVYNFTSPVPRPTGKKTLGAFVPRCTASSTGVAIFASGQGTNLPGVRRRTIRLYTS